MADENCIFRSSKNLLPNYNVQFFHQPLLFLEGSALNFSSPKTNCQKKVGQNNKWNITKTLALVQVCWPTTFQNPKMLDKSNVQVPKTLAQGKLHFLESLCINTNSSNDISTKVMYPKYSKHWLYLLAYRSNCRKILNHGLNHVFFFFLSFCGANTF